MRKFTSISAASLAAVAFFATTGLSSAASDSCSVVEKLLVCADGAKDRAMVAKAFASPDTMKNLQAAGPGQTLFGDGYEREDFRVSLEKARKALKSHSDRQFRQYRRRKITAEEYESVRTSFNAGMDNYQQGMKLYRARSWFSPSRDRNAEAGE